MVKSCRSFQISDQRAEAVATAEFDRLGAEPVGEFWDGDMGDLAETANDKGIAFCETMSGLRQSVLNLFAVGLFPSNRTGDCGPLP